MKDKKSRVESSLAQALAPEDVRAGMFIALLHEVEERSCYWCDREDEWWRDRGRRFELSLPCEVEPLRVKAVCLPFVLVETTKGEVQTVDTRRYRLARLTQEYGKIAFAKLRKDRAKEKKESQEKSEKAGGE